MNNLNSALLTLRSKDFINGLVVAVAGAVLGVIYQSLQQGSFDMFTYDWLAIGKLALNSAIAYLIKKFFSSENGKVFGKIG